MGHAAELPPGRVLDDRLGEDLRRHDTGKHSQGLPALAHQLPVSQGTWWGGGVAGGGGVAVAGGEVWRGEGGGRGVAGGGGVAVAGGGVWRWEGGTGCGGGRGCGCGGGRGVGVSGGGGVGVVSIRLERVD